MFFDEFFFVFYGNSFVYMNVSKANVMCVYFAENVS